MPPPYNNYLISALFLKTNRIRKVEITGSNPEDCFEKLRNDGYTDPFKVEAILIDHPTERQLEYAKDLGIIVPDAATKQDVSALISFNLEDDTKPISSLVNFAWFEGIMVSEYIGERELMDILFYNLPLKTKIAFFAYSVFCHYRKERIENLNESLVEHHFYKFAEIKQTDTRFVKSLERHRGRDLLRFGTSTDKNGWVISGSSLNTIAYKTTITFLLDQKLIKIRSKSIVRDKKYRESKSEDSDISSIEKGCAFVILVMLLILILIFILY